MENVFSFNSIMEKWFRELFLGELKKSKLNNEDDLDVACTIMTQMLVGVGVNAFCSWGISEMYPTYKDGNVCYVLDVDARLYKGLVNVVYNYGTDLYDIYLGDELFIEGDCADTFAKNIDRRIEVGNDPAEYDKFCGKFGINFINLN